MPVDEPRQLIVSPSIGFSIYAQALAHREPGWTSLAISRLHRLMIRSRSSAVVRRQPVSYTHLVFTSEDYGEHYAKLMGAKHVSVDRARQAVPCSATMIRSDPYANWDFLEPPVRAWYAKRVCFLGAESTGTTTLAEEIAAHFDTIWTPEYGREYSALKQANGETTWTTDEFVHIATEQNRREDEAARAANRVLIGDTNSFATCLWHRRYMGHDSEEVQAVAAQARCDLYLLTGDEIPFVQDGLRDGEAIRHAMHEWFEAALLEQSVPWQIVRGSRAQRLNFAIAAINGLFQDSAWRHMR